MRLLLTLLAFVMVLMARGQDSLYKASELPTTPSAYSSDGPVWLGTQFRVTTRGSVNWFRYYTSVAASYDATLFNETGNVIATKTFTSTGRGWQRVNIPNSVVLDTGKVYTMVVKAKSYDALTDGFKAPVTVGNLVGLKGVYNYSYPYPTLQYQKVSYMITPIFEKEVIKQPLISGVSFRDSLLKFPTDSIQLKGYITSGDDVTYEWVEQTQQVPVDSPFVQPPVWRSTELAPWLKKMTLQEYHFIFRVKDKWGMVMETPVSISVVQPIMLILSDGSWIMRGNILTDPRTIFIDETPPSQ